MRLGTRTCSEARTGGRTAGVFKGLKLQWRRQEIRLEGVSARLCRIPQAPLMSWTLVPNQLVVAAHGRVRWQGVPFGSMGSVENRQEEQGGTPRMLQRQPPQWTGLTEQREEPAASQKASWRWLVAEGQQQGPLICVREELKEFESIEVLCSDARLSEVTIFHQWANIKILA